MWTVVVAVRDFHGPITDQARGFLMDSFAFSVPNLCAVFD